MANSNGLFLKHAAIYGFGTLLLQAASVVLLPLYTHCLAPADFGVLEILSRTGQVLGIVLMANGIATATFAFYCQAKTPEERRTTAATVTCFLWTVLLVGGLLVVAFAQPLGALIGVDDPTLTAVGILAAFFDCATVIPMCLAQTRTESVYFVGVSLVMFVCRVLIITVAVVGLGWGIWGILWASILTSCLFGVILNLREFWGTAFRPDIAMFREIARFALPFVPGGLCFFVLGAGDRFFLVKCVGTEELGLYSLGCKLAGVVGMLSFTPLFKVWSAQMYDTFALPNAAVVVGRAITRMVAAYVFVGLGLCVFIDDVVRILTTPAYARATAVVAMIVLAGLFSSAATLMDGVFYAHRRTGPKPWIALASMIVMCSLYAWLIPQFGAMGAAFASMGGYLFLATATWAVSQRIFRVQYEFARIAGMLTTAVLLVVLSYQIHMGVWDIPLRAVVCAAWPLALWISGLVTPEEKALVLRCLQRALRRSPERNTGVTPKGSGLIDVDVPTSGK
jgi:O-antigen/teichoic acid export membrane protein